MRSQLEDVLLLEKTNRALNRRVVQLKEGTKSVGQLKRQLERERESNVGLRMELEKMGKELTAERRSAAKLKAELVSIKDDCQGRNETGSQTTLTMQSLRAKRKLIEEKRKQSEETKAELESTRRATAKLQTQLESMKPRMRTESSGSQTELLEETLQIARLREELGRLGAWLGETTEKLESEKRTTALLRHQLDPVQSTRATADVEIQTVLPLLEVRQIVALKSLVKRLKDDFSDALEKIKITPVNKAGPTGDACGGNSVLLKDGGCKNGKKRKYEDRDEGVTKKFATPKHKAQTKFVPIQSESGNNSMCRVVTTHQGQVHQENQQTGKGQGGDPVKIMGKIADLPESLERRFSQNDEEFLSVMNDLRPLTNCQEEKDELSSRALSLVNTESYAESSLGEIQPTIQQLMMSHSSQLVSSLYNFVPQTQTQLDQLEIQQQASEIQQLQQAGSVLPQTPPFHQSDMNHDYQSVIASNAQHPPSQLLTTEHCPTPSSSPSTTALGFSGPMAAAASAMAALAAYQGHLTYTDSSAQANPPATQHYHPFIPSQKFDPQLAQYPSSTHNPYPSFN